MLLVSAHCSIDNLRVSWRRRTAVLWQAKSFRLLMEVLIGSLSKVDIAMAAKHQVNCAVREEQANEKVSEAKREPSLLRWLVLIPIVMLRRLISCVKLTLLAASCLLPEVFIEV